MKRDEHSAAVERQITIVISAERAAELDRLAQERDQHPNDLASKLLEAEIQAQHGLTHGPWLRKYMYR